MIEISRSTTISCTDDSFLGWVELGCGWFALGSGMLGHTVKHRVLHATAKIPSYIHHVYSKTQAKCSESKGFKTDDEIIFEREQRKPHFLGGARNARQNLEY